MNNEIKENKDTMKNTHGGFADFHSGPYVKRVFNIGENEAKILNIQPGQYRSAALADAIKNNTPYLGSKVLQKLFDQKTDDDMLEILTGDIKSGEGLGFTRN